MKASVALSIGNKTVASLQSYSVQGILKKKYLLGSTLVFINHLDLIVHHFKMKFNV